MFLADSLQWVIKKTRLLVISHALAGDGVASFDHEAIHVGCSFRSSLLNGVEQQEDNDPQDREHGHDYPAPPGTFLQRSTSLSLAAPPNASRCK
jgi:hypothetical protein